MKQVFLSAVALFATGTLFATSAAAQVGTPYCFGVSCPCGNDDPSAGCGNLGFDGSSSTGASLLAIGGASTTLDNLSLQIFGMQGNQFGLIYTGGAAISLPFGDGHRCVGAGAASIYRFPLQQSSFFGEISQSNLVATSQGFPAGGEILPGSTWYYQGWYRDPGGPCSNQFNLTNALPVTWLTSGGGGGHSQLAGNPLGEYPWFDYVSAINEGEPINMAFDPALETALVGQTADVYIVAAKTAAQWGSDPSLADVRIAGKTTITFSGTDVQTSTYLLDMGTLTGTTGTDIGIGYDMVIDLDQDGMLDVDEPIDGRSDEAGFYVVRDVAASGPYGVIETLYSGGSWLGQNLFYPSNIASLGQVPLIVVSHGNGHDYRWYDHIGMHMASYGYVVMSHQNNTSPGIETASTTTLTNTDYILGNLGSIAGGILNGHIDSSRITWLGHSRGAEGVVRAYKRVLSGQYTPNNYTANDIKLVSSIAPVTHLSVSASQPEFVNFHLWVGSADADVQGFGGSYPFAILERAKGYRSSITLQGAGHGAFHNGGGSLVANGPCQQTRAQVHAVMRGQFLPLVKHYIDGDIPSKDFLWRQWESFKPIGAPPASSTCVVVTLDYQDGPISGKFVVDDYETQSSTGTSSSGSAVTFSVSGVTEGNLLDSGGSLAWTGSEPMNGMTRARSGETHRGTVFEWNGPAFYELAILPSEMDFSDNAYLNFRACQGTRHPNTTAVLEDLTFKVTLRDGNGITSSISCGAYGGGIEEPYQRTGFGSGAGWANEFESVRIRLTDFLADTSAIDLTLIEAVRFDFGGAGESAVGRIGLDEIEITTN